MQQAEVFNLLKEMIADLFEINPNEIKLDTDIYEDLDIDSIDVIDLAVKLRELTGERVNPDDFRQIRTIQNLVDTAMTILDKKEN